MRFWTQLSSRDRLALIIGAVVILFTGIVFGVILPYQEAMARLDSRIDTRRQQIQEVQALKQEYQLLQRQITEAESRLSRSRNFSLFSFVEGTAARVASKENLVYMRPQPASTQDGYREESVEIRLDKLQLEQLVRFLYAVDSAEGYLQVKNLRVRTRFDDRSLLDATMTVSHYGKSS